MPTFRRNASNILYYELIKGDMGKPCLVFLHEGLGCTAMWKGFPEKLCKITGCPGLVYDRLGYGQSSPLSYARTVHYLHEYALQELPAILDKVIPGLPFILVGHSDGGSIGLIYGAERIPLLQGIITVAAHVFVEPETLAGIAETEKAWAEGQLRSLAKYHGEKSEHIFNAWSETWLSPWFRHWNIEYLLPSIEVDLLVIQGAEDKYGSVRQVDTIVTKSSGKAQPEILDGCGHSPHQEAQGPVLDLMSDFVKRMCPSRGKR